MTQVLNHEEATFYEVLQIQSPGAARSLSKQDVRAAYHRALLLHHPDRSTRSTLKLEKCRIPICLVFSVDQITEAFRVLSNPTARAEYDKKLQLQESGTIDVGKEKTLHAGLDTFDLEELIHDESSEVWYRGCRCGDERGYVLTEVELEQESAQGEIHVGCKGCSLWIKVLFGFAGNEEEAAGEEARAGRG